MVLAKDVQVQAEQCQACDDIHGHAKPVHQVGSVTLRNDLALQVGHCREVHANGSLKDQKGAIQDDPVVNLSLRSSEHQAHGHGETEEDKDQAQDALRVEPASLEQSVGRGAYHDGDHEAGEH